MRRAWRRTLSATRCRVRSCWAARSASCARSCAPRLDGRLREGERDMKEDSKAGPLEGIRIVDAGMLFAGPLVTTALGDLGAEVIKIEHPKGDEVRNIGRHKDGHGLWWRIVSRNKKLAAADITKPEGAAIVRRLIDTADVFVENFRPGRIAEWGLGYETLQQSNPGLVMLHISGYGQTGPYSSRPGL